MSKSIDEFLDKKLERMEQTMLFFGGFEKESDAQTYELLKELKEYRQLKAAGLLLKLPCKIGQKAYSITNRKIVEEIVSGIEWDGDKFALWKWEDEWLGQLGRSVFLAREEAEHALKEGVD